MRLLHFGIRLSQSRPGFAQTKAQLAQHTLALAHPHPNAIALLNPSAERFSLPKIPAQASGLRRTPQDSVHSCSLSVIQTSRPTRALPFGQSR
jgi:hypothetical protein